MERYYINKNLFEELSAHIYVVIYVVIGTFNQKDFPNKTLDLVKDTSDFIEKNTRILNINPVEQQLRNYLIDLSEKLKKFRNEALTDSNDISQVVKNKSFTDARKLFKKSVEFFCPSLEPTEEGLSAPSTAWPKTFKILQKILG